MHILGLGNNKMYVSSSTHILFGQKGSQGQKEAGSPSD
jgi:hypothetical protein